MTAQFPGTRQRGSQIQKTPGQLAAAAEYTAFKESLKAQGGKLWVSEDSSKVRMYFERTDAEYADEINALRDRRTALKAAPAAAAAPAKAAAKPAAKPAAPARHAATDRPECAALC